MIIDGWLCDCKYVIYLFGSHYSKSVRLVHIVLCIVLRRDSLGRWGLPSLLVNTCSTTNNTTYTK